jgi:hypothetical protein
MSTPNNGCHWLACEDEFLAANLPLGWEAIADKLGRSPEAVEHRYKRLRRANKIVKRRDPRRTRWHEQQIGGVA